MTCFLRMFLSICSQIHSLSFLCNIHFPGSFAKGNESTVRKPKETEPRYFSSSLSFGLQQYCIFSLVPVPADGLFLSSQLLLSSPGPQALSSFCLSNPRVQWFKPLVITTWLPHHPSWTCQFSPHFGGRNLSQLPHLKTGIIMMINQECCED